MQEDLCFESEVLLSVPFYTYHEQKWIDYKRFVYIYLEVTGQKCTVAGFFKVFLFYHAFYTVSCVILFLLLVSVVDTLFRGIRR
jgi:hypothetical protein